eukprot:30802-Pelagococcus_subviridis.AAC.36
MRNALSSIASATHTLHVCATHCSIEVIPVCVESSATMFAVSFAEYIKNVRSVNNASASLMTLALEFRPPVSGLSFPSLATLNSSVANSRTAPNTIAPRDLTVSHALVLRSSPGLLSS